MIRRAATTIAILLLGGCLVAASTDQYGAAAWRQLKFLLTDLSCSAPGTCDLAAGTTIGGSPIGGGGGVSDGDKGDVVVSGGGTTWLVDDGATVTGWILGTLGAGFTTGGDITMADNDIVNPDAVGAKIYYVDSVAEAQAALTRCGSDITGSTQSGCIVQFTGGLFDNGGTTLHMAGDGTAATGRAGVIIRGVGGGTAAGDAGSPNSGTIIKASGAVPIIDVGACMGCMIENLTLAGEDTATIGIDFLAPASTPTTRFVVRNVSMYEINGYGLRTPTTGQVDTMIFENVSVRDSDGCYQQRYTQTVGVILSNFDCSLRGTASGPVFDIQQGEFTLINSFVSLKFNEVGIRLGTIAGRTYIDGNQIELGVASPGQGSDSTVIFDFDEGTSTAESAITVSNNHIVYARNGNTLFDVQRKGSVAIMNNWIQDLSGTSTISSDIMVDDSNSLNRLYLTLIGNHVSNNGVGGTKRPERWAPTLTANPTHSVLPTLGGVSVGADTLPTPCLNGEIGVDTNGTSGQRVYSCEAGSWVLQGDGGGSGGGYAEIAAAALAGF